MMNTAPGLGAIMAELASSAAPHRTVLTGGPVTLHIAATGRQPLVVLTAATAPYLRAAAPDRRDGQVAEQIRVHTDPGMADHLNRFADPPQVTVDGVHLVRATAGHGQQYREAFLLWDRKAPRTSYLVLGRPGPATDKITLRLVRGIASRVLIGAGWVPLHAAGAVTRIGLLVLAGPSSSGKTTTLLHLLNSYLGHALVGNDKIYLQISPSTPVARALPTSLALRPDTTAAFPATRALAGQAVFSHVDNRPGQAGTDRRLLVPPQSLADAFGLPLRSGGRAAAIVAIRRAPDGRPSQWRPVAPEHALAAVTPAYLANWFIDEPHEHARLQAPTGSIRVGHHRALRRIAAAVPVIELSIGTAVPRALESILTELA